METRQRAALGITGAVLLLVALYGCVVVKTAPTPEQPDGGTAVTLGVSSDDAATLQESGLLDFLPAPLRGVAKAALLYVTARAAQSTVTKSGRANWSVIADRDTEWSETGSAFLANTLGTSSPPVAVARRADVEVARAPGWDGNGSPA